MTTEAGLACTRCNGSGFRDTPRAHLDIPGLCFDCDGDGTRETQLRSHANRKETLRRSKLQAVKCAPIEKKIWDTRSANRIPYSLVRERWPAIVELKQFTTQQYADRVGISKAAAWVELCCNNRVYVAWSPEYDPIGWTFGEGG